MRTKPGLKIAAVLSALIILLPLISLSNTVARRRVAKADEGSPDHQGRVTQNGVIEMNGCVVRRDDLTLTATPVQFASSGKHNGDDDEEDDNGSGDDQQTSLPTFNDLVNQGLDYVEGEIADESGLPKDAVDAVTRKVIDAAKSAQGGGAGLPDWLADDNRFRPSKLILTVTRPATTGGLPAALVVGTDPNSLYPAVSIPLPSSLNPTGAQLTIPVQLAPNLNGTADLFRPPFCLDPNPNDCFPQAAVLKFNLNDWFQNRFQQIPCSTFKILGLHGGTAFEDLGSHALVPQGAAQFPTGNSNSCP